MSDLIERQAAIDALEAKKDKSAKGDMGCFYNTIIQNDIDALKGLPSAQPERKKGKWIDKGWNGDWQYQTDGRGRCWHEWQCSECNDITKGAKWDFCPNCGADMRGEQNE